MDLIELRLKWPSLPWACSVCRPYKSFDSTTLCTQFCSDLMRQSFSERKDPGRQLILVKRRSHWHGPLRLHKLSSRKQRFAQSVFWSLQGLTCLEGVKEKRDSASKTRCCNTFAVCHPCSGCLRCMLHAPPCGLEHENSLIRQN